MERLIDYAKELRRKIDREIAWNVLQDNFDGNKPRRFVSGIVVSSDAKNSNGDAFKARGLNITLPIPVLWNHEWLRPIGRVTGIETVANEVRLKAEISNSGRLQWAEDAWSAIVCQSAARVSMQPHNLASGRIYDRTLYDWRMEEISIAEAGADPSARIRRVWERAACVSLYRPTETLHWSAP